MDDVVQASTGEMLSGFAGKTKKTTHQTQRNRTADGDDDDIPRNDEEVMLARPGPWQACLCGGGGGQPLETSEGFARVISAPCACTCTPAPSVHGVDALLGKSSQSRHPAVLPSVGNDRPCRSGGTRLSG